MPSTTQDPTPSPTPLPTPSPTPTPPPFSNDTNNCYPYPILSSVDLTNWGLMLCQQVCSYWCWATTVSECVQYLLGKSTGSCALNECYQANILLKLNGGNGQCCVNGGCNLFGCNVGAQPAQVPQVLLQNGLRSTLLYRALTEYEIKVELSQYRPIIMGFTDFSSGHVVLLYGFTSTGKYLVSDPWPQTVGGAGLRGAYTYQQIQTYAGKPWTLSVLQMVPDMRCIPSGTWLVKAPYIFIAFVIFCLS
jgi:hypothetical protein